MFITLNEMTPQSKKEINRVKRDFKKNLAEIGMPVLKNHIKEKGGIMIPRQVVNFDYLSVANLLVQKYPERKQEVVDGVKAYSKWVKEWSSEKEISKFIIQHNAVSCDFWSLGYMKPEVFTMDEFERKIYKYLEEEELEEIKLKRLFSKDDEERKYFIEGKARLIDAEKKYEMIPLVNLLAEELNKIIDVYKKQIDSISIKKVF